MDITKKYKNPPLTEAVFELFYEASNWTPAIPGEFYSIIKSDYPIITQSPSGFGVAYGAKGIQIGSGNSELTQYRTKDNQSIIQLSNNLYTVNKLPVYSGWESYKIMIMNSITSLKNVLDIKKVNRVGLRTINKIDIRQHSYDNFKNHFNAHPSLPSSIKGDINSIHLNFETQIEKDTEILAVNLSTLRKEPGYEAPTLFQLYYTRIREVELNEIENWLEIAHNQLHISFESILTKECKSIFDND
jgi:uncharacterized protein (TIGR04255 family)